MKLYTTIQTERDGAISVLSIESRLNVSAMSNAISKFINTDVSCVPPACVDAFVALARDTGEAKENNLILHYTKTDDGEWAALYLQGAKECKARWAVAPCHNIRLDSVAMCDIAYTYAELSRHDRVREGMWNILRNAGAKREVDFTSPDAEALIAHIVDEITRNVEKYGCDEDWSLSEALSTRNKPIRALLRLFEKGDIVNIRMRDGRHIEGYVSAADAMEFTVTELGVDVELQCDAVMLAAITN